MRFIQPTLPPLEYVTALYRSPYAQGLITNGALVSRFEDAAAERLGVAHAVAVSSCTAGLMLTLRALGLRGDVILPSFTFFATAHAVAWNGLRPVFADCHPETWNLDPDDVERRITERTCAILGVHLYGNPCDVESLEETAAHHRLALIFDAAHSFGSLRGARPVGQFGDAEVFSLSPTKLLVAGEGGLVTTNDAVLARRLRAARNYGDLGAYDPELVGLNARMSEFHAAMALAGLDLVELKAVRHNQIASRYTERLSSLPGLRFQKVAATDRCAYKDYSICIEPASFGIDRDQLAEALRAEGIETRKYFYPPLHRQTLYRHLSNGGLPHTERVSSGVLSLPIYESLSDEAVERVAASITSSRHSVASESLIESVA